jgi:hypothetical protein
MRVAKKNKMIQITDACEPSDEFITSVIKDMSSLPKNDWCIVNERYNKVSVWRKPVKMPKG